MTASSDTPPGAARDPNALAGYDGEVPPPRFVKLDDGGMWRPWIAALLAAAFLMLFTATLAAAAVV